MSQGYDQFFKKANQNKQGAQGRNRIAVDSAAPRTKKANQSNRAAKNEETAEDYLREVLKVKAQQKTRKRHGFPTSAFLVVILGVLGTATGYYYPEKVRVLTDKYTFGLFGDALAADEAGAGTTNDPKKGPAGAEKSAATKNGDGEKSAESAKGQGKSECAESKGFTEEELSHFNKLNERKKELDLREAELNTLEEELHKQKSEVETRIAKLEQIREEVATVLKDRVEVDQQRVNTLVEFYSNMKPKQAADVFAKLNEDLAVEVLGKMKKKNAADILNLLDPAKARVLSEKFTGYKRD